MPFQFFHNAIHSFLGSVTVSQPAISILYLPSFVSSSSSGAFITQSQIPQDFVSVTVSPFGVGISVINIAGVNPQEPVRPVTMNYESVTFSMPYGT